MPIKADMITRLGPPFNEESRIASPEARIAKSFLALASGDAVARVVAFAASVYVARTLGASMYGVIGFASAVVLYFTHIAACGIDLPGVREIAADASRAQTLAPGVLTIRLLVSAALAALLAALSLAFLPSPEGGVLALYSLTLLAVGPNPRWVHLGLSSPRPVALARTAGETVFVLLVLLLVREPGDIFTVPWAQFIGDALATALMVWTLAWRGVRLPLRVDWQRAKPIFAQSWPMVVNILLGLLIFNCDLIFLRIFRERATVGWYTASYQLISFLINIAWTYSFSLLPQLTRARGEERERVYRNSVAQTFAVGLPIAVGGALLAPSLIALVFGAEYEPSGLPLRILVLSLPFMLFKDVGTVALVVSGRERTVMKMTAIAMLTNVGLNALVIPRYSMVGAACTTLATEVLRSILAARYVRAEGWPRPSPARFVRPVLAAAGMGAVLWWVSPDSVWAGLALGVATYAACLLAAGGIELRRGAWPSLRV
jgi:O-antigen/teichoic acid export membrane protein